MLFNFHLGLGSDKFIDLLSVLEKEHSGNALDEVTGRNHRVFVDVQFRNFNSTGIFCRQLIKDRGNRSTRSTPRCPAIHEHGPDKRKHFFFKRLVGYVYRIRRRRDPGQWCATLSAKGMIVKPSRRNPVFCKASGALNDNDFLFVFSFQKWLSLF